MPLLSCVIAVLIYVPAATTRLTAGERGKAVGIPTGVRVELVDPHEGERQENAKKAAEQGKRGTKKGKGEGKGKGKAQGPGKRTLANGEEVPTSSDAPNAVASTPDAATQVPAVASAGDEQPKAKPKPKKVKAKAKRNAAGASLTENASDALRAKVVLLPSEEREGEITRLNSLGVEALAMEGELARVEALGADAVTQDEFVQQAPDSPRGNSALSSLPTSSFIPSNGLLEITAPFPGRENSPFTFPSNLHMMPELPVDPFEPLVWSAAPPVPHTPSLLGDTSTPEGHTLASPVSQQVLSAEADASPVDLSGAPAWFMEHYQRYLDEDVPEFLLDVWLTLLRNWSALESAMEFSRPKVRAMVYSALLSIYSNPL